MSFETWLETSDIPEHYLGISHVRDAFEAGRAESEAQIAALQSDLTKAVRLAADYGIERDALQSERDALKESVERLLAEAQEVEHIRCLQVVERQISRFTGPTGGWLASPKEVFAEIAVNMLHRVDRLTLASGEPVRKP